jgi:hypothetical protein
MRFKFNKNSFLSSSGWFLAVCIVSFFLSLSAVMLFCVFVRCFFFLLICLWPCGCRVRTPGFLFMSFYILPLGTLFRRRGEYKIGKGRREKVGGVE